tara:strand:- start:2384 stop:2716 length:333 start_codon:yes stop_codon:yes gene_type:complete
MANRQSRISGTSFYRISLTYQHQFDTPKEYKTDEIWTYSEETFLHPLNVRDIVNKFLFTENYSAIQHGYPEDISVKISGPFKISSDNTTSYTVYFDDRGDLYLDLSKIGA